MNSYSKKLMFRTILFSAFFLGICVLIVRYLPAAEPRETEKSEKVSGFNSYTTLQGEALAENLFEEPGFALENADFSPAEDKTLALYRNPQSRPAVEWFYSRITANRDVALAILEFSDKTGISPNLAFALAYVESRFKPNATNINLNCTIDRGLFQLNSATFPNLTEDELYDPRVSAKYGLMHLRYCIDVAGNEITGLAIYNAGAARVKSNSTPQQTLNYVSKVSSYRTRLETQFVGEVLAFYSDGAANKSLAMAAN